MKISVAANKKSRGRPKKAGGVAPVSAVRLPHELTEEVDKWGEDHGLSRSEAIRRLVELGLTVKQAKKTQASRARADRAKELAGHAIDQISDLNAHPEERANRGRRLTKGPEEFRNIRVDRPKK
jgi:Arc/MetJ-type ribon-helix-helix transcriptional regulator